MGEISKLKNSLVKNERSFTFTDDAKVNCRPTPAAKDGNPPPLRGVFCEKGVPPNLNARPL
jgi:hypothetical protein